MPEGAPMLRVKVPCADEGEFYSRLADRIAANGLRVPADAPPAVGARARVALEFKDGGTLAGDAVVEEHVEVDDRPGVKVRFVKLDRAAPAGDEPLGPPAKQPVPAPARAPRASDAELAEALFGDAPGGDGRTGALAFTVSTEIAAAVERRTARARRGAAIAAALAVVVAVAGVAIARWSGGPDRARTAAEAHVQAAERLIAERRLVGKDGALEHLLAAKRLVPHDAATARRLEELADMFERLAGSALDRGDLAVASIHLASARAAAPERGSLQAKQAELDRRIRAAASR